jgi:hypothetical protein
MSVTIKDGTGTGKLVGVTDLNRIQSTAVTETISAHTAIRGNAYNFNTGTINLTSANKSALAYIKNNEDEAIVVTAAIYLIGNTTGGSAAADTLIQIERNPTGGTIVDNATTQAPVNRNFGSTNTLAVDAYKGAEGYTLTGGTVAIESIFSGVGRQVVGSIEMNLEKGNSIGVTVTPKTSNTSQDFQIALVVYKTSEII